MDNGIWATWYNLDETGKDDHINWLHNDYLPNILTHDGVVWAAHYVVDEQDYKERRDKLPSYDRKHSTRDTIYMSNCRLISPHLLSKNSPLFLKTKQLKSRKDF